MIILFNISASQALRPDQLAGGFLHSPRCSLRFAAHRWRVVATCRLLVAEGMEQPTKSACPRFRACSHAEHGAGGAFLAIICGGVGYDRTWRSSRPCYARRLNFHVRSTGAHSENSNNFADYIVDAILRFIFRIRTCFARIYFCVDILNIVGFLCFLS